MTQEAQNIAIAESLGWTDIAEFFNDNFDHPNDYRDEIRGLSPNGYREEIHDYTGSLDACAEFEATLADTDDDFGSRWQYIQELIEITGAECMEAHRNVFTVVNADAPQRCEAYLRAIWKWEESE